MKNLFRRLKIAWRIMFAKQWFTVIECRNYTYRSESMVVKDILNHCRKTHNEILEMAIDETQADINLKEVSNILNQK